MVDLMLVLEGTAYLAFIVGAIFAVFELRELKRDRRMDVMMRASEHTNTREFEDAMGKLWRSNANDAKELEKQVSYTDLAMIGDFFNHIAWLGTNGIIDKRTLVEYFPFGYFWEKLRPWVEAERENAGIPSMYTELEALARLQDVKEDWFPSRKRP